MALIVKKTEDRWALPKRWTPLKPVPAQIAYINSPHRFNILKAGRRSGKTERFKRKVIVKAVEGTEYYPARFFAAAPTRDQAKKIFWDDLKSLVPFGMLRRYYDGELIIVLKNGSEIHVVGLDKPQRIEGQPWDGGGIDEFDDCKPQTWEANVRPALSDRQGWCDLFGVPEGRKELFKHYKKAIREYSRLGLDSEWAVFEWLSSEVLPAKEIESARNDLDDLTFKQEYEAQFVNFEGKVYYPFNEDIHVVDGDNRLKYDPYQDLILCFDFNVSPGTASILQEQELKKFNTFGTGIIGEVYIPRSSNTKRVVKKIIEEFGNHQGNVFCYGDASGGAKKTSADGTDWTIIEQMLVAHYGTDKVHIRIPKANPEVVTRINAVNARLMSANGTARLAISGSIIPDSNKGYCENIITDFDSVTYIEGGAREIDKSSPNLSHLTDGIGYYIAYEFPITEKAPDTIDTDLSILRR